MQFVSTHRLALLAFAVVLAPSLSYGQSRATLDASFGTGGKVITNFGGDNDFAHSVVIQPDGKIVAAGTTTLNRGIEFALARYNSDGTLDTTFGVGGIVTADFGITDVAFSVALQTDGKILAAGVTHIDGINNIALARYNSDGTLDASFGTDGRVTDNFAGVGAVAFAVAPQPDGKIVAAGWTGINGGADFALVRYNGNGTLDAGFGTAGRVITDFADSQASSVAGVFSIAVQPDGKIVAAGDARIDGKYDFTLARYNSNGTLDAGFGTGGKVITDFAGSDDGAEAVALQPDGKIVAAGFARSVDFGLARYNSNGTLDASFGTGGKVTTDFGGFSDAAFGVAIQPDGKIVAAGGGITVTSQFMDFALARYNSDGSLDAGFGKVTTDFAGSQDQAFAVAVQPDGKIVAAGQAGVGLDDVFALSRYEAGATPTITVTVTGPNGGETLYTGSSYRLDWMATGSVSRFDVESSSDGGASYVAIPGCSALAGTIRSCTWVSPGPATSNGRIRVTARDAAGGVVSDVSNAAFNIASGTASITVTYPNTAINAGIGSLQEVKWTHNLGANAFVKIELSRDGGLTYGETLAQSVKNTGATTGTFAWRVSGPATTGGQARIRVSWTNGVASDVSNTNFTIAPVFISVTAPSASANWGFGTTQRQTWTTNLGALDKVDVQLSTTGTAGPFTTRSGGAGIVATRDTANVIAPSTSSTGARVRVIWTNAPAGTSVSATNPADFKVQPPFIALTAPASGQVWTLGGSGSVTWSHNLGALENVKLELSKDGGATYPILVLASTPSDGRESVTIQAAWGSQATTRVRISWVKNASVRAESGNFTIQP
jgi:uncharacterized delta-60 repeat protein